MTMGIRTLLAALTMVGIMRCWSAYGQTATLRAERELFASVNQARQAQGLSPLRWNESLATAAGRHAGARATPGCAQRGSVAATDAPCTGGGRARTPVAPLVFSAARDRRGDPCRGGRRNAASLLQVLRGACALVCCPRRDAAPRRAAYPPPGEYAFHIFRVSHLCRPPALGGTGPPRRSSAMHG